ncbi:MAG: 2-isopropylmalate synthase [Armatimonadota bacterium]
MESVDRVYVFDTTLRDGEQSPGASLNVHEKLDIARQLEKLNVDVIEAGFPISSPGDFLSVQEICKVVKSAVVCALTRAVPKDIECAAESLKDAVCGRIHTGLGVSDNHLKNKLRLSREEAMAKGVAAVKLARSLVPEVEYFMEDSGRADPEYVYRVVEAMINAGACVINVPDTTGYTTPEEFGALIAGIMNNVPNVDKARISVHCHNDLGMATANALSGVMAGARQVEVTINGLGERAGNTALEEVVMAIYTRKDWFKGAFTNINTTEIYKSSRLVSTLTGIIVQPNKAIVGANAFAHSSGIHQDGVLKERSTYEIIDPRTVGVMESKIILSARSGRHGVKHRLEELGYTFEAENFEEIYAQFLSLADRKKQVYDEDLLSLVADSSVLSEQVYELELAQVISGNVAVPTATVQLKHTNGQIHTSVATGTGPVDACYQAIDKVVQLPCELMDYSMQSVTEGIDAQAEVTIRIRAEHGDIYTGRGANTDIVVASCKAYLQALNKLLSGKSQHQQRSEITEGGV